MRAKHCVTMMDPFEAKYSRVVTAGLSLTSFMVEIICLPTTMIVLGASFIEPLYLTSVCIHVGIEAFSFSFSR